MTALAKALDLFQATAPRRPYCTDDKTAGQYQRRLDQALRHRLIQPNTTGRVVWLAYDCDVPGSAVEWHNWNAPPPTLAMENPVNGHAHLVYALEAPVPTTEVSRRKPLLYLAAVNEGLRRAVKGDMGYSGRLMKTPGHPAWRTTSYAGTYGLAELADYVELPSPRELLKKARNPDYAGLGRNCTLFERLRTYSYSAARNHWRPGGYERFLLDLEHRAIEINFENDPRHPLGETEVRAIAKSVAKWTWTRFNPADFHAWQSAVGKKKGAARRAELGYRAVALRAAGVSLRDIAAELAVPKSTVSRWLGRPDLSDCPKAISDIPLPVPAL